MSMWLVNWCFTQTVHALGFVTRSALNVMSEAGGGPQMRSRSSMTAAWSGQALSSRDTKERQGSRALPGGS